MTNPVLFKEILGDAYHVIEQSAPILASIIGAPLAGPPAQLVLKLIGQAFNVDWDDLGSLTSKILEDEDAQNKLSELEKNFADWFKVNMTKIKMPTKATVNINLEWS